jgi:hypothetical protein
VETAIKKLQVQISKLDNMKAERYFNLIELTRENLMKHFDNIEYQILV